MATNQAVALKHWARIIKEWPVDRVRPNNVSFQKIMQSRIDRVHAPSTTTIKANDALVSPVQPPVYSEEKELRQVKALDSLLKNKYLNAFPIPPNVRHPRSNPAHYDELVKELEEAPTRSWTDSLMKKIKGSIRFS
ncbi:hypothetical protein LTR84_004274 [Exophiala bonariae]|uniref:Uncharacterized protein n=1 Tax=Exophiala bonariae TaxID=1690606 RepID=A0AAV9N470_9EURO|nr:hypothetical protein LTR84_004274 [Exophiala bonariae]